MPKELAHFKNFAKLKNTSIAFNDITVLAGKPSVGKSYVMKFKYAMDIALSKSFLEFFISSIEDFNKSMKVLINLINEYQSVMDDSIASIKNPLGGEKASTIPERLYEWQNKSKEFSDNMENQKKELQNSENLNKKLSPKVKNQLFNLLNSIFKDINQIGDNFEFNTKEVNIIFDNREFNITLDIPLNFEDENNDKNKILSELDFSVFKKQFEYKSIFVETPLILEFKSFINRTKGKTPYHIESLLNVLDTDYSSVDEEQGKFIKDFTAKSKEIIKGNIESSGNSFLFKMDRGNYDIINTSSGTKSIGLLQYLVTNKALKKGSVLYWEEPEVHLHPKWQLKMIELFVELMNAGVKIVFSTHSPYMADYLNAISQRGKFRERISFNVLDEKDGIVTNHILDDDNWNILQGELMDTFEDILWQYL